jgi:hypothetical protein
MKSFPLFFMLIMFTPMFTMQFETFKGTQELEAVATKLLTFSPNF